ncbi:MAG: carbohydrate ABC transporter permease [Anaerolineales bacterium]|nr:carbohydrate ABC transporter permease [Anaerolineales bacterium]
MRSQNRTLKLVVFATLVLLTFIYLMPIYVMVTTSLKSVEEINRGNYLLPSANPQFNNYQEVLFGSDRFRSQMISRLQNSTFISFSVTLLSAFFGGLAGYYLSRTKTAFARVLFVLVGIALYLPYQAVIIPLVILMAKTRLALSYWGLILAYLILNMPLASVLMGTFFLSIPRELEEAAEVDGASRIQTFFTIIMPISLPAYASVAIIIFTQVWNEFFLALALSSPQTQTVQVVMAEAKGTTLVLYNLQMAAALISVSVPLIFFLVLGRYFIRGILAGALKG